MGFAIQELVTRLGVRPDERFFWTTHAGAELALLFVHGRRRLGFEIQRTTPPSVTRSMRAALEPLQLDSLEVVYAAVHTFPLTDGLRTLALQRLFEDVEPLDWA